ncbi:MAG: hypothetical protein JXA30_10825 [Deltaproteobacteria bacterium]|nr:hypothetical protein [Deltaproteobacteria bacterium]
METLRSLSTVPLIVFNSDLALQTDMSLSLKGWERFDTLRSGSRGDRAFVAMWFDQSMNEAYKSGIEPALVSCGYQPPFRVDDPLHDKSRKDREYKNRIDDRILAEIRRARFVVADASGARPSVYYEAGFADGLGIPVIWCCRKDDERKIAFDTRQNAHILWESPNDLKEQLENKIRRFGWIPNPK